MKHSKFLQISLREIYYISYYFLTDDDDQSGVDVLFCYSANYILYLYYMINLERIYWVNN